MVYAPYERLFIHNNKKVKWKEVSLNNHKQEVNFILLESDIYRGYWVREWVNLMWSVSSFGYFRGCPSKIPEK